MTKKNNFPLKVLCALVGAGPGALGLVTIQALRYIKQADVIIYDKLIPNDVLLYCKKSCQQIYVGKTYKKHTYEQNEINDLLVKECKKKLGSSKDISTHRRLVVRLKGGDPFIFGQGFEEVIALRKNHIPFEIVPGVSSCHAVPIYAGIPLTARNYSSSFFVGTGHHHEPTTKITNDTSTSNITHSHSQAPDTRIYLMSMLNLKNIIQDNLQAGLASSTPIAIIQRGSTTAQKTIVSQLGKLLKDLEQNKITIATPGLVIIGSVVALREIGNWYETKPLFGKTIAITRAKIESFGLYSKLLDLGAMVVEMPVISISPLKLKGSLKILPTLLNESGKNKIICFSSRKSVHIFFSRLQQVGLDGRALHDWKIISVGSQTSKMLKSYHIIPDAIAQNDHQISGQDALVRLVSLLKQEQRQQKIDFVLMPRALTSRRVLENYLTTENIKHRVLPLYQNKRLKIDKRLLTLTNLQKIDAICFTSASAVDAFFSQCSKHVLKQLNITEKKSSLISIGAATTNNLIKHNINLPIITATKPSYHHMVSAIVDHIIDA